MCGVVVRPSGISSNESLPVLVWIYGGGLSVGSAAGISNFCRIPVCRNPGLIIYRSTLQSLSSRKCLSIYQSTNHSRLHELPSRSLGIPSIPSNPRRRLIQRWPHRSTPRPAMDLRKHRLLRRRPLPRHHLG